MGCLGRSRQRRPVDRTRAHRLGRRNRRKKEQRKEDSIEQAKEGSGCFTMNGFVAPHPGPPAMPRWDVGELPDAPKITLRSWALLVGPGLVAAGAAIGGGEWLAGPLTTAPDGAGRFLPPYLPYLDPPVPK